MESLFIALLCYFHGGVDSPFRYYYLLSLICCAIRHSMHVTYATWGKLNAAKDNAVLLPSWYGCGTAFAAADTVELRRLYREWPFFRTLVQNLEMTLAKASMEIAYEYLALVGVESPWPAIAAEHERTVAGVLEIVEADELLDRQPVIQRSVRLRNPYVDPMNAIQVELLRRYRSGDEAAVQPLLRSIAGIAAALRNTG